MRSQFALEQLCAHEVQRSPMHLVHCGIEAGVRQEPIITFIEEPFKPLIRLEFDDHEAAPAAVLIALNALDRMLQSAICRAE